MKETQTQFNRRIHNRFNELKQVSEVRSVGHQRSVRYHCDKRKTGGRRKVFKAFISSNDFRVWEQIVKENRSKGWLFWEGSEYVYGGKQYGMVKHEKE